MDRNTIIKMFEGGGVTYFAALEIEELFPVLNWDSDLVSDEYLVEVKKDKSGNWVFNFFRELDFSFTHLGPYRTVQIPRYAETLLRSAVNRHTLSFGLRDEIDRHFCRIGANKARIYREKQKEAELINLRQEVELLRRENTELKQIIELL